ncbi:MAG TPA: hypothetical protein VK154_08890 [Chitinophagales bacterium]|nr:hypothetical protein [Chitinophagales bacterium]
MEQLEERITKLELKVAAALDVIAERLAKSSGLPPDSEKEFILQEIDQKARILSKQKP